MTCDLVPNGLDKERFRRLPTIHRATWPSLFVSCTKWSASLLFSNFCRKSPKAVIEIEMESSSMIEVSNLQELGFDGLDQELVQEMQKYSVPMPICPQAVLDSRYLEGLSSSCVSTSSTIRTA